jgi:hypothetical protein
MKQSAPAVVASLLLAVLSSSCGPSYSVTEPDEAQATIIDAVCAEVSQPLVVDCLRAIAGRRMTGTAACAAAEAALSERLTSPGYAVTVTRSGHENGWPSVMDTLAVEKTGTDASLAPVWVMAHWDSYGNGDGMDDNGSGTAAVVEAARVLSSRSFQRTIRFLLFGNEEMNITGSWQYVHDLTDAELPEFFVNFEMIGYTIATQDALSLFMGQAAGDWIGAYAPDWSSSSVASFAASASRFVPGLKYCAVIIPEDFKKEPLISGIALSDNLHFWNRRVPGLMLSDGASLRNPYYHSASDALETLDMEFMMNVIRAGIATVCLQAGVNVP